MVVAAILEIEILQYLNNCLTKCKMTNGHHFENDKSPFAILISCICRMKFTVISNITADINIKNILGNAMVSTINFL